MKKSKRALKKRSKLTALILEVVKKELDRIAKNVFMPTPKKVVVDPEVLEPEEIEALALKMISLSPSSRS